MFPTWDTIAPSLFQQGINKKIIIESRKGWVRVTKLTPCSTDYRQGCGKTAQLHALCKVFSISLLISSACPIPPRPMVNQNTQRDVWIHPPFSTPSGRGLWLYPSLDLLYAARTALRSPHRTKMIGRWIVSV